MTRDGSRRGAAVLAILASAIWFHAWIPALLVVAFGVWVLLHEQLEGDLGRDLLSWWRRVWPPAPLGLGVLLVATAVAYGVADQPPLRKVMPLALTLFALSMIALGRWWRPVPHTEPVEISRRGPILPAPVGRLG